MVQSVLENIPTHIAVIMDGNARWAKSKLLPVKVGHQKGSEAIQQLIKSAAKFGVKYLTIFAFSTENWQRPESEVSDLMDLMHQYLEKESSKFIENGVKILISGNLDKLKSDTKEKILALQEATVHSNKIVLNVAFDYGSRAEIVDAFKKIASKIDSVESLEKIDENIVSQNLYNPEVPDPDLIIRTSGEKRLSNFLLWQAAYSEFYFTDKLWPDFNEKDLELAILEFQNRNRRYGKRENG